MVMNHLQGILAKWKSKYLPLFRKGTQEFPIYQHHKGRLFRLLFIGVSGTTGKEAAVYRSEVTVIVYVRPLREFKIFFKEFDVGI